MILLTAEVKDRIDRVKKYLLPALLIFEMGACLGCGNSFEKNQRPVRVLRASPRVDSQDLSLRGLVKFGGEVQLSFKGEGVVEELVGQVGDRVEKNQILARLENYAVALEIKELSRQLEILRSQDVAPAKIKAVEARLQEAVSRQESLYIRAPFDGKILNRSIILGEEVSLGQPVISLAKEKGIMVRVELPADFSWPSLPVPVAQVSFPDLAGEIFSAQLCEPPTSPDPISKRRILTLELDVPGKDVHPGMLAMVVFPGISEQNPIIVSDQALLLDPKTKEHYVWLCQQGRAIRRLVKLGGLTPEGVEILSGIKAGDLVIVEGRGGLREGDPVTPVGKEISLKDSEDNGSLDRPE